jgi:hypothetical protein
MKAGHGSVARQFPLKSSRVHNRLRAISVTLLAGLVVAELISETIV